MDQIELLINETINNRNNQSIEDFEGYSPAEMHLILNETFGSNSPIELLKAEELHYQKIPMLNQVKFLLKLIEEQKELKLTSKGFLPTKIVSELYGKAYLKDPLIEMGITKLNKESDAPTIHLAKILLELSSLVKKRNNKLTLTKKGTEQIQNNHFIFQHIFETFSRKFNWSYFDGFGDNEIGQLGFGFTIILLDKYGNEFRNPEFYAEKYLKAFDFRAKFPEKGLLDKPKIAYIIRSFERFLNYFGLTEFENNQLNSNIKKTEIFNVFLKIRAHNT
tara:strand:+ start:83 stop:913 length:831 start_codon:yes stop_codon:yes gene_type:complete